MRLNTQLQAQAHSARLEEDATQCIQWAVVSIAVPGGEPTVATDSTARQSQAAEQDVPYGFEG